MEKNCHTPNKYREQIASAISWELIYQLMRRYHAAYDLRVWEMHPCSGQYDCLSLGNHRVHYFDFHLPAQSLHIWDGKEYVERLNIVDEYLHCENPKHLLDKISSLAKLKKIGRLPPSDGSTLACGFIATMFKMNIFAFRKLKMYMGFFDTSGDYDGGIRHEKFALFPALTAHPSPYRIFFLEDISADRVLCLIDMAGRLFLPDGQEIPLEDMYDHYGRDIETMTNHIAVKLA